MMSPRPRAHVLKRGPTLELPPTITAVHSVNAHGDGLAYMVVVVLS
jgi:hypothetical protein